MSKLFIRGLFPNVALALLGLAAPSNAQEKDAKDKAGMQPIAVVDLKRATPVIYETEIEPILARKCA